MAKSNGVVVVRGLDAICAKLKDKTDDCTYSAKDDPIESLVDDNEKDQSNDQAEDYSVIGKDNGVVDNETVSGKSGEDIYNGEIGLKDFEDGKKSRIAEVTRPESPKDFGGEEAIASDIAEIELSSKRNDLATSNSTSSSNYDVISDPETSINKLVQSGDNDIKDEQLLTDAMSNRNVNRRNKRKNAAPRNIVQLRDTTDQKNTYQNEIEIYHENNKGVDFSKAMESNSENEQDGEESYFHEEYMRVTNNNMYKFEKDELDNKMAMPIESGGRDHLDSGGDGALDLSCSKTSSINNSGSSMSSLYKLDDCGALDLSSSKASPKKSFSSSLSASVPSYYHSNTNDKSNNNLMSKSTGNSGSLLHHIEEIPLSTYSTSGRFSPDQSVTCSPDQAVRDASMIQDYAQTTVNELLSMYGLDEEAQSFAKSLPLQNLSTGSILDKWNSLGGKYVGSVGSLDNSDGMMTGQEDHSVKIFPRDEEGFINEDSAAPSERSSPRSVSPESVNLDILGNSTTPAKVGALYSPLKNANFPDYGKYVKRYGSFEDCGNPQCADLQYREHFHCVECTYKVFLKKEEMIRHFKWHRKRDESLQHGFMRYSPMDDCSKRFNGCVHNERQTHYHCLQPGCSKVYISTSDVQMHSNYHRKDSAIMQLGFQRFRATEDCGTQNCPFYGQRTTHFHCRKPGCNFTFKNKADIEKHKTYHQKDEILAKDGFKKFMKYEACLFPGCRFSKIANHIHCIRPGCDYVLHSTSQLLSHKRKHERREIEFAYRKFKEGTNQQAMLNPALAGFASKSLNTSTGMSHQLLLQQQQQHFKIEKAHSECSNQSDLSMKDVDSPRPVDEDFEDCNSLASETLSKSHDAAFGFSRIDSLEYIQHRLGELSKSMPNKSTLHGGGSMYNIPFTVVNKEEEESLNLSMSPEIPFPTSVLNTSFNESKNNTKRAHTSTIIDVDEDDADDEVVKVIEGSNERDEIDIDPESPRIDGTSPTDLSSCKVSPLINERKEKDESWKTYLTRYTANDPCQSRCPFLYKDHYHCNVGDCERLYRSKDGVREHAKLHEHLDRITELSYMIYDDKASCIEKCPYNMKEKHYHCLWTECNKVIAEKDPIFTRLEHYQGHENSRCGRKIGNQMLKVASQDLKKRRGRPPKYPKIDIPMVPKIEMSENDISAETERLGKLHPIAFGYKLFVKGQQCPDDKCIYYMKEHYHCVRKRCHHATDNKDVLNLHAKEFHNYITIQEGFEFFDRTVNCRRPHCHNNKANRHFHCVRPKCDYSFVRYSTMSQHDKKHKMAEMGLTPHPTIGVPSMSIINPVVGSQSGVMSSVNMGNMPTVVFGPNGKPVILPEHGVMKPLVIPKTAVDKHLIKSTVNVFTGGSSITPMSTMRPIAPKPEVKLNGVPQMMVEISVASPQIISTPSAITNVTPIVIQPITTVINTLTNPIPATPITTTCSATFIPSSETNMPLAGLLKKGSNVAAPQLTWQALLEKQHFKLGQNCNRPFCKLKRKDHYHCIHCNQAFSDPERLRSHVIKHGLKLDGKESSSAGQYFSQIKKGSSSASARSNSVSRSDVIHTDSDEERSDTENDGDDELDVSSSLNLNPMMFTNMLQKSQKQAIMLTEEDDYKYSHGDNNKVDEDDFDDDEASNLVMDLPPVTALDEPDDNEDIADYSMKSNNGQTSIIGERESNNGYNDTEIVGSSPVIHISPGVDEISNSDVRRSTRKRSATKHDDFIDSNEAFDESVPEAKSPKMSAPGPNSNVIVKSYNLKSGKKGGGIYVKESNSDVLPDGYEKYANKVECPMPYCTYKKNLTHYHCMRPECNFGTTDRSRLLQHSDRHRRTDEVLGDEFRQFRGNAECDRADCENSGKGTHYHCLKCPFICTDMSKVMAHRKHHNKMEAIEAQGFSKFTGNEDCGYDKCNHRNKQTHYHCVQGECMYIATGPQQIQLHNKTNHSIQIG